MDNDQIVNLLIELKTDVSAIKTRVDMLPEQFFCLQHSSQFTDHETRLRKLESYINKFLGALILGNVFTGVLVVLLTYIFNL